MGNRIPIAEFNVTRDRLLNITWQRLVTWRKILLIIIILLALLPVIFAIRISSSSSVVLEAGELDVASSAQVKALAIRLRDKVLAVNIKPRGIFRDAGRNQRPYSTWHAGIFTP